MLAALGGLEPAGTLAAGNRLANIGLNDERIIPELCRAARKPDARTREGLAVNLGQIVLDTSVGRPSDQEVARRLQLAFRELGECAQGRGGCRPRARRVAVLAKVVSTYQRTGAPAFLETARDSLRAIIGRMEDENESGPLRLEAMDQWVVTQPADSPLISPGSGAKPTQPLRGDLHARALWIAALGRSLGSPLGAIRTRSIDILMEALNDPGTDPSFRQAWRKIVPLLADAARSKDDKVRLGALTILARLGPEAKEALPDLRPLVADSTDTRIRAAAEEAVRSVSSAEALRSDDPSTRAAAAEAVGKLGWRATIALPGLIAAVEDSDREVRRASGDGTPLRCGHSAKGRLLPWPRR